MEFIDAVKRRRSIRLYTEEQVPDSVVEAALEAALLAPNSSNMQTWEFHWVKSSEVREKLAHYCLDQGAARTAQHLIVAVSSTRNWNQHRLELIRQLRAAKAPDRVFDYYEKLIPFLYGWRFLGPIKGLFMNATGLFRPMTRGPWSSQQIQEVSVKSCALACENLMLSVADQGFDTCPMEGFDEVRVKKLLGLPMIRTKVVMIISVGRRDPKGLWGEQIRFPKDWVIKKW